MLLQNSLYYHHYYKHMHFIPKKDGIIPPLYKPKFSILSYLYVCGNFARHGFLKK